MVGIIGPNGSGKTTLIKCINNILTPKQGRVLIGGSDVKGMRMNDVAKKLAYVPQNSERDMNAPNVYEVVLMGRRPHTPWQYTEKDDEIVWKNMKETGVAHLASRKFDELSSGQLQRVLIARALTQEAKILLLDEPTSNLDVKYQIEVMDTIRDIVENKNVGACIIIHDLDLAYRFCDRIVMMGDKKIKYAGAPEEVMVPDNIRDVFEVNSVIADVDGTKHVVIVRLDGKIDPSRIRGDVFGLVKSVRGPMGSSLNRSQSSVRSVSFADISSA